MYEDVCLLGVWGCCFLYDDLFVFPYRCSVGTSTTPWGPCLMTCPSCPAVASPKGNEDNLSYRHCLLVSLSNKTIAIFSSNDECMEKLTSLLLYILCIIWYINNVMITSLPRRWWVWYCCRFLVPGWRLGWVVIHDRHDAFHEVRHHSNTVVSIYSKFFPFFYPISLFLVMEGLSVILSLALKIVINST